MTTRRRNTSGTIGPFFAAPVEPNPDSQEWGQRIEREIPASQLSQSDKTAVWRLIKADHPERAAFFDDPQVKKLMQAGAVPTFPPELIRAARNSTRSDT